MLHPVSPHHMLAYTRFESAGLPRSKDEENTRQANRVMREARDASRTASKRSHNWFQALVQFFRLQPSRGV